MKWSFPLQLFGLMLASIELRYPALADKIEGWIDDLEHKTERVGKKIIGERFFTETLTTLFVFILFVVIIPDRVGFYHQILPKYLTGVYSGVLLLSSIVICVYIFALTIFFLSEFIKFLNKFSNGRAIGTVGLIIGIPELLEDIYTLLKEIL